MSKLIPRHLGFIGIVIIAATAMALVYLKRIKAERTVVFQIHSSISSEFSTLVDENPEFIPDVRLSKNSSGPDLWEFQVPIRLSKSQAMERKEMLLGRLRDWLEDRYLIAPQIGLVVHSGAGDSPTERTDEWAAPVVELLSEGVLSKSDEVDE
ncbi:MAG: hypothetical protein MUF31_11785 [Akkermansiaceae bacterium]|jgi:hypothetical protein|nr:hypothetical protein [Akkermansiaceae bacterium]